MLLVKTIKLEEETPIQLEEEKLRKKKAPKQEISIDSIGKPKTAEEILTEEEKQELEEVTEEVSAEIKPKKKKKPKKETVEETPGVEVTEDDETNKLISTFLPKTINFQ